MPRLSMLTTIAREITLPRHQPRIPEPMVMTDQDQVEAYCEAGRIDGIMSASYLFQSARISQVIQGCVHVLDLGCGPTTQLAQVAALNPNISFTGLDLSEEMLASGRAYCAEQKINNVDLRVGDITRLTDFADHSVDGIMSTMALHQLPEFSMLESVFREISRILKPGGALYLVDFGRLKSPKSCHFFAHLNAEHQPPAFTEDYLASLHAAFLFSEYKTLTNDLLPPHINIFSTLPIPMLTIIKSPDRPLPQALTQRLSAIMNSLPTPYRRELKDMRVLTSLGGLKNDPFHGDKKVPRLLFGPSA